MALNEKALSFYKKIIKSAENHGQNSEPDHEIGDLQDALSTCMELLTEKQLAEFIEEHQENLDNDNV